MYELICDMDCFNCKYPDCINNSRETKAERRMKETEKPKKKSTYYERNRERILAKQKKYNSEHRAERREYEREYYRQNSEEKKEWQRNYHRERSKDPEYVEKNRKRCAVYREKERLKKEMYQYELMQKATYGMRTAAGVLEEKDSFIHCLTITIDRWCADRGKDDNERVKIAREVMDNFVQQREIRGRKVGG